MPIPKNRESSFDRVQREYFEAPEVEHFRWTTRGAGFAETEDELLAPIMDNIESPCLELGCGEGNNLLRATSRATCFGIDLHRAKLQFASQEVPAARLSVASADALPFADASFRCVLIRDVLHHVQDPKAVLAEAVRVLVPGGQFWLLEPNHWNPVVRLQTALVEAEARVRQFNPNYVARLLNDLPLDDVRLSTHQPFPLRRVILHYQMGLPILGTWSLARVILAAVEKTIGLLVPRSFRCYIGVSARRVGKDR